VNKMLTQEAILQTATTRFSVDDDSYVTQSCLFPRVLGTGDTEAEALADFTFVLSESYEELVKENVKGYNKKGRPAKHGVNVHMQVPAEIKEFIDENAARLQISQGDFVSFLVSNYHASQSKKQCVMWVDANAYRSMISLTVNNAIVTGSFGKGRATSTTAAPVKAVATVAAA